MNQRAHEAYLEAQVRTATPQKLRLMLIDGALRFAHRARQAWSSPLTPEAITSLSRCRKIVLELRASIRPDEAPVARQVADLYEFLYRTICEAQVRAERQKLEDLIEVLTLEQQTWRELCERMPEPPQRGDQQAAREIVARGVPAIHTLPYLPGEPTESNVTAQGLSFEA